MFEAFECYFSCLARSETGYIMFGMIIIALSLGTIFLLTKKSHHMFLSQMVTAFAVMEGFRQMTCSMAAYVWIYLGIISGAMVFLGMVNVAFDRHIRNLEIMDAQFLRGLSAELGCRIYLLDTQKIKAFTHKRKIYVSVGLVELLEPEEIIAVAAHELYHVKHTPNRYMANFLAVASLWLRSYRDEAKADGFAAELAGRDNLITALKKLKVAGLKKREKRIAA
ncbi:MAG: M48 family metalloprotease [Thermoplasmata archaeon]|nr:MAG: M48 family metalloprotease [Thermoplasmata archaeon]